MCMGVGGRPYFYFRKKNEEKVKQRAKRSTIGDRGIEMLGSSAGGNKREKHGKKHTT
jgi:hypothetical protein